MFSFHRFWRNVAALFVVSCLFTAMVFTGCKTDPDFVDDHLLNEALIGTWVDDLAGDSYVISETTLEYDDGWGGEATGTIKYVSNFSNTAGVIIIQWNGTDAWGGDENKFIGVYYKDLKPGISFQMGTASLYPDSAGKDTKEEAIAAFTVGNESTYMSYYGAYTKQQ